MVGRGSVRPWANIITPGGVFVGFDSRHKKAGWRKPSGFFNAARRIAPRD
jgi:hypothetical protein